MRKLMIGALLLLAAKSVGAWEMERNPDRRTSFGISYNGLDLGGSYSFTSLNNSFNVTNGLGWAQNNIVFDGRFPVTDNLTLTAGGGWSNLDFKHRDDTVGSIGATIVEVNEPVTYHMTGYNFNIGIRFYIN